MLLVSRLVPEKRHLDLIAAFQQANLPDWKLVLVGGSDHPDAYQREVMKKAAEAGVVMTGFQQGLALQELYSHAGLFVCLHLMKVAHRFIGGIELWVAGLSKRHSGKSGGGSISGALFPTG